MLRVVVSFLFTCFTLAGQAVAQDRAILTVSYLGGHIENGFVYHNPQPEYTSSQAAETNGMAWAITSKINNRIGVGGRVEYADLRNPMDVTRHNGKTFQSPFPTQINGSWNYYEGYLSVPFSKIGRDRFILGVSRSSFSRTYQYALADESGTIRVGREISSIGLTVGIEGERKTRHLTVSYLARYYPRLIRKDKEPETNDALAFKNSATGFEIGGSISYSITRHVALTSSIGYRRTTSNANYQPDSIRDRTVNYSPSVGIRVVF